MLNSIQDIPALSKQEWDDFTKKEDLEIKEDILPILNISQDLFEQPREALRIETNTFQCIDCGYNTHSEGCYNRHLRSHQRLQCYTCNYTGVKRYLQTHLKTHLKRKTDSVDKVECYLCSKTYRSKNHLQHHIKYIHISKQVYQCPLCAFVTFYSHVISTHINRHTVQTIFCCYLCGSSATTKEDLKRHIEKQHIGEQFKCNDCDYVTATLRYLTAHKKKHVCRTKGIFSCNRCPFNASTRTALRKHLKCHSTKNDFEFMRLTFKQTNKDAAEKIFCDIEET